MLTPRRLVVFNLVIFLLGLTVLYSYASTTPIAAPPGRLYKPQSAARAGEATHLSYISYTKNGWGVKPVP